LTGGKWRADILRHTAASYLITKYQDVGKVAFWLGNSPQIIMTHYHEPVMQAECEKFWTLPATS
jgi:integrase